MTQPHSTAQRGRSQRKVQPPAIRVIIDPLPEPPAIDPHAAAALARVYAIIIAAAERAERQKAAA